MSKEKQCECCHEWWYDSDVKENLCPNCYDYFKQLKQQLEEKDKELLEFKRNKLYFELLITRLQWLHKRADEYKEEKERFGIDEEISLSSVWDVLSLQKNNICEYEEMCELQEGIECIANSRLLKDIEHDLQIKVTRKEDEIFKDIEQVEVTKQQLEEKDKEIAHLKDAVNMCQSIKRYDIGEMLIENAKLKQNQTQLAIQELEKVKNLAVVLLDGFCHSIHYSQKEFRGHRYIEFYDLIRGIDNQIEELKGE